MGSNPIGPPKPPPPGPGQPTPPPPSPAVKESKWQRLEEEIGNALGNAFEERGE